MGRIRKVFDVVVHNVENGEPSKGPLIKSHVLETEPLDEDKFPSNILCISIPQITEDLEESENSLLQKTFEIPDLLQPCTNFRELPQVDLSDVAPKSLNKSEKLRKCADNCRDLTKKQIPETQNINEKFTISIRFFPLENKVDKSVFFDGKSITVEAGDAKAREFSFDHVFSPTSSNAEVYEHTISHMRQHFLMGKSGTCFTFGQTCSGKTYTLFDMDNSPGICFQFAAHVLSDVDTLGVSVYEIYYEKIKDLLSAHKKNPLLMCSSGDGNVKVLNLTRVEVGSIEEIVELISDCLDQRAADDSGSFKHSSSRSHLVVKFENTLQNNEFYFIDLAGSERARASSSTNWASWNESANINSTLLALKECIRGYAKNSAHVPFRRFKITRLLNHVFRSYKIFVICTVREDEPEHSLNTLEYARQLDQLTNDNISPVLPNNGPRAEIRAWRRKTVGTKDGENKECVVSRAFSKQYVHKLMQIARKLQ